MSTHTCRVTVNHLWSVCKYTEPDKREQHNKLYKLPFSFIVCYVNQVFSAFRNSWPSWVCVNIYGHSPPTPIEGNTQKTLSIFLSSSGRRPTVCWPLRCKVVWQTCKLLWNYSIVYSNSQFSSGGILRPASEVWPTSWHLTSGPSGHPTW